MCVHVRHDGDLDLPSQMTEFDGLDGERSLSATHQRSRNRYSLLEPPMTYHPQMPRHVVELFGNVFAKINENANALRAAHIIVPMNNVFAPQVFR